MIWFEPRFAAFRNAHPAMRRGIRGYAAGGWGRIVRPHVEAPQDRPPVGHPARHGGRPPAGGSGFCRRVLLS
jgi:hypothetical protein